MRIQIYSIFILSFISFQIVSAQDDKLIGKWGFDMKVMKPYMLNAFEKEFANPPNHTQKKQMREGLKNILEDLGKITIEFKADGTFEYISPGIDTDEPEIKTGVWEIKDGYLHRAFDKSEKKDKVKIKKLSAKQLIIIPEEGKSEPFKELTLKHIK